KSLVWPARVFSSSTGEPLRGEPDATLDLSNRDPALPRVFETFKGAWETFPLRGMHPLDWNRYPPNAQACADSPALKPGMLVLAGLNEFGNTTENPRNVSHVLVTQEGKLVRYLAGFNKELFNRIREQMLYDGTLPTLSAGEPPLPRTTVPEGSITVKSAWIE